MRVIFRWLVRLVGTALILGALAVMLVYYLGARSLPDYDKELELAGLNAPVEIVRDNSNVPHIMASDDADAFFGLGYVHAQDRLWQMTLMRRTAQGRLSEVFGTRTVETDKLLRRLDLYTRARESFAAQDDRTKSALRAYAAGVNARIEEINSDSLGRGAPEFFLFGAELAPWQPADSLSIIKLMALQLSGHLSNEVLRARTSLALEDGERLADILPDAPGTGVAALPEYSSLAPGATGQTRIAAAPRGALWPVPEPGLAGASNAWAADPTRSASGGALLANDPHLGFTAPAIWYLARMELSSGGVIGGSIPGIPAIMVGRSETLGWGLTSAYLDDQDLFLEKLNPEDSNQYQGIDGWQRFETRRSIIDIKDAPPVTVTLRWTDNGPVLPGTQFDLGTITPPGHVMALSWTALSGSDTSMSAAVGLMFADTIDTAIAQSEAYVAPAQMLTLTDGQEVAMQLIGAMPERDAEHQSQGRMPAPGWIAANRWQGNLPYSANPSFTDPVGGIVGNTNNKVLDRPFPLHVSYKWGDSQRIQRWRDLMQGREVHTRDSFIEFQLDTVSEAARTLLPLVGADLWFTGEAAPEGTPERRRRDALDLLAEWNGEMSEHLPEPLIYAAWLRFLQDRLIRDDLGPLADEFTRIEPLFLERVYRDVDGAAAWCDVTRSAVEESCSDLARLALDDALIWIEETYNTTLASLRWGDAHEATHDHQVLGEVPVLQAFVNIRQSTSGGDFTLQRGATRGRGPNPFLNVHGAGYRGVYDFADPDSSVFITSTGQSGHFLSRHYDDLGQLWRRGEYIPMSLDPDLARAAAVGITNLVPAPE
ncbi:Penicillin acylase 2 precursor [Roseivivax sp. THAF40]|uniref:penicillin acylase family protein n=1 Tax=unclassified Roseivivax TaxID=2639302 RepID=UPI00126954D4|nr:MULTISPECIES: penicillin acylase family protein [unclassified Roseivivax]QFS83454.1 Penicillin acylase 2 precursor [Roseivivax sp. THAF197b]QFT47199.1 Penicillin acylase 2 precursor [Roseivivax sp. THAF40]